MDERWNIRIRLASNLVEINAALDSRHRIKFMLLAKKRRDLMAKLEDLPAQVGTP